MVEVVVTCGNRKAISGGMGTDDPFENACLEQHQKKMNSVSSTKLWLIINKELNNSTKCEYAYLLTAYVLLYVS